MAKVLVVDDDEATLSLTRQILDQAGHSVQMTDHGSRVVPLVKAFRPALLLTDIFMPDLDGFEVIRMVRAVDDSIRIVVISGNHLGMLSRFGRGDWPYYLRAAQCLGADSALKKPFTSHELLTAVDNELTGRSSARSPLAAME